MKAIARLAACLLMPGLAWADVSGYVDTSYNYLYRNHTFISRVDNRLNDLTQNGFTLQQAAVTWKNQPEQGLGGVFNVVVGRDANPLAPYGWNPYFGSQTLAMTVPQAYLQYAIGKYKFIGGMFNTLVGAEDYNPTLNTNFSGGILNTRAEPGVMMGVRSFIDVSERCRLNVGVNNGWSGIRDTSRQATLEYGGTYTVNSRFELLVQGLSGEQRLLNNIAVGPMGRRNFIEVITVFSATEALTLMASGDYGLQNKALDAYGDITRTVWRGIAGYANYAWTEKWHTSLRGEVYDDQDGYTTGVRQNWRELTLTFSYAFWKNALLRAETRRDFSNVNSFMRATGPGTSNNQQSYALEALFKF